MSGAEVEETFAGIQIGHSLPCLPEPRILSFQIHANKLASRLATKVERRLEQSFGSIVKVVFKL